MLKQTTAGAVLSLMLAGTALAVPPGQSAGAGMGWHHHRGAALTRLQSQLAITSAQEPAWTRFTQALAALRARPARPAAPASAGLTPAPQVFAALADRAAAKAKEAHALADAANALYRVLTPVQRAVLDTQLADFRAMHRHRREHGHRYMHGPEAPRPSGR